MSVEHVNPDTLFKLPGFGQISIPPAGKRLAFVAGQTALDAGFQIQAEGFAEQVQHAVDNVIHALDALNATPDDVVHMTFYIVGLSDERFQQFAQAWATSLGGQPFPSCASAVIGVERLALSGLLVEMSAVVAID
ncbi:RidA family protein [Sphingomonas jatrophae]|uniref:Enamine deaminase RidA, house cleaning of reactive enamine intermediates, YjgF/YER057c/UK114 family n=1 Tax=Sphingomonas jatrophae TaxID=1166337 RepID=A0A1I6L095_9SPHN|nr:RidA family protein [Sphingomonas jatrophae]SFR96885.1 Enamine deaminase RidA, house cleaning of reactive enamine intermediates, YjgF/YER057c/UK114 family [Sphingomonas jatrophae]